MIILSGQDPADFSEENAADRIGHRIRRIREARNISITELANRIDVSADMLQKYENGQRKPRAERLKKIASELGVSTLALLDPYLTSSVSVMYALFELEERFDLSVSYTDDGQVCLTFDEDSVDINTLLSKWIEKRESVIIRMDGASDDEKKQLRQEYLDWEWSFPQSLDWKPSKDDKERERAVLERKLRELNEYLNRENSDGDV